MAGGSVVAVSQHPQRAAPARGCAEWSHFSPAWPLCSLSEVTLLQHGLLNGGVFDLDGHAIILSTGSCMSLSLQLGMDPASLSGFDGDARMRKRVPCALGPRPDWATAISAMAQDL